MASSQQHRAWRGLRPLVIDAITTVAIASFSAWQLFEMDLFWTLRAGKEIVDTASVPMIETWSYTARGAPWLNTHWMTELTLYSVYRLGGYAGLVAFRVALSAVWIAMLLHTCRQRSRDNVRSPMAVVLVAMAFVASTYRIELRGEMFVLLAFTAVLMVWLTGCRRAELSTAIATMAAANFHAGQAIMVLALGSVLTAWHHRHSLRSAAAYCALQVAAFFVTPVHLNSIGFVHDHLFYKSVLHNPDHQPLTFALFDPDGSGHGLSYWAWLALTVAGAIGAGRGLRSRTDAGPPMLLVLCGMTLLCLDRVRAVPFAVAVSIALSAPLITQRVGGLRTVVGLAASAVILVLHTSVLTRRYGTSVDDKVFPVQAAEFIRSSHPAPNLYHTFTFGAYFVWALQDYAVFGDTRETPFKSVSAAYGQAYSSPLAARALHQAYDVNTIVVPVPGTERIGDVGWRDVLEEFTPRSKWALVYFDDIAVVLVRRIPENDALIASHEFKILRPNIPAIHYAALAHRTGNQLVASELKRCLAGRRKATFCDQLKALLQARL